MLTAFGTVEEAVKAMKDGAIDFLTKPFQRAQLIKVVRQALERRSLIAQNRALQQRLDDLLSQGDMIGVSPAFRRMMTLVQQVADSSATVLIQGESGTGQGAGRARHPRSLAAPRRAVRRRQLRRAAGDAARVRAVRLREGRVHRRGRAQGGPLRAGRRRHALPRRGRRPLARDAAQDPARAPGGRVRARRRHPDDPRRRAHRRRHESGPGRARAREALPRGPLLPAERHHHRRAAAARAPARTSRCSPSTSCACTPRRTTGRLDGVERRGARLPRGLLRGRAMSASSRTWSSAPSSSPAARASSSADLPESVAERSVMLLRATRPRAEAAARRGLLQDPRRHAARGGRAAPARGDAPVHQGQQDAHRPHPRHRPQDRLPQAQGGRDRGAAATRRTSGGVSSSSSSPRSPRARASGSPSRGRSSRSTAGPIRWTSTPGAGATFTVTLPIKRTEHA